MFYMRIDVKIKSVCTVYACRMCVVCCVCVCVCCVRVILSMWWGRAGDTYGRLMKWWKCAARNQTHLIIPRIYWNLSKIGKKHGRRSSGGVLAMSVEWLSVDGSRCQEFEWMVPATLDRCSRLKWAFVNCFENIQRVNGGRPHHMVLKWRNQLFASFRILFTITWRGNCANRMHSTRTQSGPDSDNILDNDIQPIRLLNRFRACKHVGRSGFSDAMPRTQFTQFNIELPRENYYRVISFRWRAPVADNIALELNMCEEKGNSSR